MQLFPRSLRCLGCMFCLHYALSSCCCSAAAVHHVRCKMCVFHRPAAAPASAWAASASPCASQRRSAAAPRQRRCRQGGKACMHGEQSHKSQRVQCAHKKLLLAPSLGDVVLVGGAAGGRGAGAGTGRGSAGLLRDPLASRHRAVAGPGKAGAGGITQDGEERQQQAGAAAAPCSLLRPLAFPSPVTRLSTLVAACRAGAGGPGSGPAPWARSCQHPAGTWAIQGGAQTAQKQWKGGGGATWDREAFSLSLPSWRQCVRTRLSARPGAARPTCRHPRPHFCIPPPSLAPPLASSGNRRHYGGRGGS